MKIVMNILCLFMVFSTQCLFSQTLTGEYLSSKLKESAVILNDYQNMIADKDKDPEVKRHYMAQALNLFVNQGNPFSVDSTKYQGSSIITKSALRDKLVRRKIKDYFQGVMDLRYVPIDLTMMKIPSLPSQINLNDLVKYGDNQYKYTILVTREHAGYIDGTPVYKDITPYEYTLFLSLNKTIDGTEYNVYLNDIEIEEKEEGKK